MLLLCCMLSKVQRAPQRQGLPSCEAVGAEDKRTKLIDACARCFCVSTLKRSALWGRNTEAACAEIGSSWSPLWPKRKLRTMRECPGSYLRLPRQGQGALSTWGPTNARYVWKKRTLAGGERAETEREKKRGGEGEGGREGGGEGTHTALGKDSAFHPSKRVGGRAIKSPFMSFSDAAFKRSPRKRQQDPQSRIGSHRRSRQESHGTNSKEGELELIIDGSEDDS